MIFIYTLNNVQIISSILYDFILTITIQMIWVVIIIAFLVGFGNPLLIEFIIHPFSKGFIILDIVKFGFMELFLSLLGIIQLFLIAAHLLNPISLIRIYLIQKGAGRYRFDEEVFHSFYHIFLHDSLLLICYIINWLIPFTTIKAHNSFRLMINSNYNSNKMIKDRFNYPFYVHLKYKLILETFEENTKYLIVMILTLLNLTFIWKIKSTIKIMVNYRNSKMFQLFFIEICINSVEAMIEFFFPLVFLFNYMNPINYLSLHMYANLSKKHKKDNSFFLTHLVFFVHKNFDILITYLDFLKLLSPTYYLFLLYQKSIYKKIRISYLFPILFEDEDFYEMEKVQNDFLTLEKINNKFTERRLMNIKEVCKTVYEGLITLLNLPSIFDIFSGMRIIRFCIFMVKYVCKPMEERELINGFDDIREKYKLKMLTNFRILLKDLFIYYPLSIIILVLTPWNLILILKHSISNNYIKQINKIKKQEIKRNINLKRCVYSCEKINSDFFSYLFNKAYEEFFIILKVFILHITIIRVLIIWKHFLFIIKNHRILNQEKKENENENIMENKNFTINLQEISYNVTKINLSKQGWSSEEINFLELILQKALKLNRKRDIFLIIISENFKILILDIIVLPIVILLMCFGPWNLRILNKFLCSNSLSLKIYFLWKIFRKILIDYLVVICCFILLISVHKTTSILHLIFYTVRIKINPNDVQTKTLYEVQYKGNFKEEVFRMSKSIFSFFIIVIMFILNMLLITQIPSTIRRTYRFVKREINKDFYTISKFYQDLFKKKEEMNSSKLIITELSNNNLYQISQFLEPNNIINLGFCNKKSYLKMNVNLIWKFQFDYYYKPILEKNGEKEILSSIDEGIISNYKSLCKDLSEHTKNIHIEFTEEQRDRLIGLRFALFEEFLNSLLRLPHLILLPFKIIGLIHLLLEYVLKIFHSSLETNLYRNYLMHSFKYEVFFREFGILTYLKSEESGKEYFFYNLQIYFLAILIDFSIFLCFSLIGILSALFTFLLKLITYQQLNYTPDQLILQQKKQNLSNSQIYYQTVLGIGFGIIFNFSWFTYFYYLPYKTHFDDVISKSFEIEYKYIDVSEAFYLYDFIFNFLINVLNRFYQSTFTNKLLFIFGTYGIKAFYYCVFLIVVFNIKNCLNWSNVIIVDYFSNMIIVKPKFNLRILKILRFIIFPLPMTIDVLNSFNKNHKNYLLSLFLNFIVFISIIYPFYLNFIVNMTVLKFLVINTYGISNTMQILNIF